MRELVAASGVPKSTILHYLNEGLLPPPVKTGRNVAYYDPSCVERLNFIKFLQKKHRLPLEEIKEILQGPQPGREFLAFQELNAVIFGRQPEAGELLDQKAFGRATGLSAREVKELLAAWNVPGPDRSSVPLLADRKGVLAVLGSALGYRTRARAGALAENSEDADRIEVRTVIYMEEGREQQQR